MKKKFPKLTNSESEMMEVLWNADKPLTSSKIVAMSQGQTWKPSYVHILINSLLKKEMIEVAGFEQSTGRSCLYLPANDVSGCIYCWTSSANHV